MIFTLLYLLVTYHSLFINFLSIILFSFEAKPVSRKSLIRSTLIEIIWYVLEMSLDDKVFSLLDLLSELIRIQSSFIWGFSKEETKKRRLILISLEGLSYLSRYITFRVRISVIFTLSHLFVVYFFSFTFLVWYDTFSFILCIILFHIIIIT